jgi:hypothetical protein
MVRWRYHLVIKLGRFNDAVNWIKEMNAISVANGLTPGKFWAPSFGKTNACVYEIDYPNWETFHRENDAFFSSADCMKVFRSGIDLNAEGHWPWDEALEEAATLA